MRLTVHDIDHTAPALGGAPSEFDRCCVLDQDCRERHPLTGEAEPAAVYYGTRAECAQYVADHLARRERDRSICQMPAEAAACMNEAR